MLKRWGIQMERYTVSSLLIGHLYATRRAASDVWILIDAAAFKTVFTTMLHSVWLKLAQAHPSQAFLFAFKLGLCFIDGTYHGYIILETEELDPLREYNSAPHIYLTDEHINPQDSSSNKRSGCLAAGKTQQLVQRSKLWSVFVPESSRSQTALSRRGLLSSSCSNSFVGGGGQCEF